MLAFSIFLLGAFCVSDNMFLNLYTDKAKGILSEQRFVKLTAAMEREPKENLEQLKELPLFLRRFDEQESNVCTFIREIRQYAAIQALDEGISVFRGAWGIPSKQRQEPNGYPGALRSIYILVFFEQMKYNRVNCRW